jgi:hypothetical protein
MLKSLNIDKALLDRVLAGQLPRTTKIGSAKVPNTGDNEGYYGVFLATERETGKVRTSRDGLRIKLNLRPSKTKEQLANSKANK